MLKSFLLYSFLLLLTTWKVSVFGVFLVRIFSHLDEKNWIRTLFAQLLSDKRFFILPFLERKFSNFSVSNIQCSFLIVCEASFVCAYVLYLPLVNDVKTTKLVALKLVGLNFNLMKRYWVYMIVDGRSSLKRFLQMTGIS